MLFSDAVPPQPRTTEEKYTFKALSLINCSNFVFASQMALLDILPQFLSFTSLITSHLFSRVTPSHWEGERVHSAGVPERIGALIIIF